MNPTLLTLMIFLAGASLVVAVGSVVSDLFLRDRERVSRRVDDEFREKLRERAKKSLLFKDLGQIAAEVGDGRPPLRERVVTMIDQSGLDLTIERFVSLTAASSLVAGSAVGLARRSLVVAAIGAALGAALPLIYVHIKRLRRLEAMRAQLPDAFDLMARIIRSGQTMAQGQLAVADEFQPPIAAEFSYCYEQQNLGLSPELALRDLARRTGLLEIRIFVTALLVQQQTGGNLAELLENLAGVVRERFKTRGKIKALTAEGRYQGLVLLLLAPGLFLVMLAMNREFASVLLDYPQLIMAVLASEAIGAFFIHRIVNFDF